jgi:hypothetical protein
MTFKARSDAGAGLLFLLLFFLDADLTHRNTGDRAALIAYNSSASQVFNSLSRSGVS